jgi:hypothetical protein
MKTTSAFKLNKSLKRILCLTKDKDQRNEFKKLFIQAQLTEESFKKRSVKVEKEQNEG